MSNTGGLLHRIEPCGVRFKRYANTFSTVWLRATLCHRTRAPDSNLILDLRSDKFASSCRWQQLQLSPCVPCAPTPQHCMSTTRKQMPLLPTEPSERILLAIQDQSVAVPLLYASATGLHLLPPSEALKKGMSDKVVVRISSSIGCERQAEHMQ
jgi:hypothetical protein